MATHIHLFDPGAPVTFTTSAAVVGGQLLAVTGNRTAAPTAGINAKWVGVAGFDAASGERVTVVKGGVQRIMASGTIAAGDTVVSAADGKVATVAAVNATAPTTADANNTRAIVGTALTGGTNVLVEIDMDR